MVISHKQRKKVRIVLNEQRIEEVDQFNGVPTAMTYFSRGAPACELVNGANSGIDCTINEWHQRLECVVQQQVKH